MRAARSYAELDALILADIRAAIAKAEEKAKADLQDATNAFYTGSPKKYVRTDLLRQTPRTESTGGDAGFRAYLDTSTGYTTGSNPGMETVLGWAETGAAGVIGHLDWDAAERRVIDDADAALKEYFV